MGPYTPLPYVRLHVVKPDCGRRQPNDAHEHRDAPSLSAAVSAGKNTGDDKVYLHRKLQITFQLKEQGEFSLFFQLF